MQATPLLRHRIGGTIRGHHVPVLQLDRLLAGPLRDRLARVGVGLALWDDWGFTGPPRAPNGEIIVGSRRVLHGLLLRPDVTFGDEYMAGGLAIRGPLQPLVDALMRMQPPARPSVGERLALALSPPNSLDRSRRNVHHHYDLGNEFYRLWLDHDLLYTCAYYEQPEATLEQAQRAKLDLVCRKVRLRPGDRVLEAGCGWGALALHMARAYGAMVTACNISHEQIRYAQERAVREGLQDRVTFVEDDYRNVRGAYDVFVSVGMLEHVGRRHFGSMAEVIRKTLRHDTGRILLHFIGRDHPRRLSPWIRRRIFPGAYPPTLAEITRDVIEPAALSVIDVENLRQHYARTLHHWRERFEQAQGAVCAMFDDAFVRAWDLYLAGSEAAFVTGWLQLFQVVATPCGNAPLRWTRGEMYPIEGPRP